MLKLAFKYSFYMLLALFCLCILNCQFNNQGSRRSECLLKRIKKKRSLIFLRLYGKKRIYLRNKFMFLIGNGAKL